MSKGYYLKNGNSLRNNGCLRWKYNLVVGTTHPNTHSHTYIFIVVPNTKPESTFVLAVQKPIRVLFSENLSAQLVHNWRPSVYILLGVKE